MTRPSRWMVTTAPPTGRYGMRVHRNTSRSVRTRPYERPALSRAESARCALHLPDSPLVVSVCSNTAAPGFPRPHFGACAGRVPPAHVRMERRILVRVMLRDRSFRSRRAAVPIRTDDLCQLLHGPNTAAAAAAEILVWGRPIIYRRRWIHMRGLGRWAVQLCRRHGNVHRR